MEFSAKCQCFYCGCCSHAHEVCVLQGDGMDEHDLLEQQQRVRAAIFMFTC